MFSVGQKVICINDESPDGSNEDMIIRKGHIYTVRAIGLKSWFDGGKNECILLEEIVRPFDDPPYWAKRFRPIVSKPTDIQFAYDILNKITKKEDA